MAVNRYVIRDGNERIIASGALWKHKHQGILVYTSPYPPPGQGVLMYDWSWIQLAIWCEERGYIVEFFYDDNYPKNMGADLNALL